MVTARIAHLDSIWWSLAQLPALAVLFVAGWLVREEHQFALGAPLRHIAVAASILAVAGVVVAGAGDQSRTSTIVAWTIAVYGFSYLIPVVFRRNREWTGLCASTLTLAAGYNTAFIGWSWPQWACGIAVIAAFWLVVGAVLSASQQREPGETVFALTALVAGIAAATALLYAGIPHEGTYSFLALGICGTVFAGLFVLAKTEIGAHVSFGCYLAAYALFLYDRVHLDATVLDLYLIPVGLYLLVVGHVAANRGSHETSSALWWMGSLTIMTPTYFAFNANFTNHGTPLHAFLLLSECIAGVAWGISHRIKAFVFSGVFYTLAFAGTLVHTAIQEIWSGVFAVVLGVLLLTFVFYVSASQEAIRKWLTRMGAGWRQWR